MDKAYYSEYSRLEETHWWFTGRKQILDRLLSNNPAIGKTRCLLNVGCGTGNLLRFFQSSGRSIGLDVERKALDYCVDRGLRLLVQGSAPALPFKSECFDVIMALDVLEHLDDHSRTLSEFWRICANGGYLVVTVPAFHLLWGDQDLISHHRRRYTLGELRRIVEQTGFLIEKMTYFNTFLFPIIASIRLVRRLKRRIVPRASLRSDFTLAWSAASNHLLGRVFASEASFLSRWAFPFGVSLFVLAKKGAVPAVA